MSNSVLQARRIISSDSMSVAFKSIQTQICNSLRELVRNMKNSRSMVNLKNVSVVHLNVDSGYITYLSKRESSDRPVVKGITLKR